ncbi:MULTISPECIES: GGDEF domain-containing phosphodiesterase [Pseudoalteromonas]|uniref:putative bifunctional diguanylate cyclase/phosphodiesterase n=1 Tax=Pseudoalteromonas TaxID=53246 RepID=UPI0002CC785D|nr:MULTISPECIES: GGDEF domain-containing phosphodiesterase [Pseudoalteromonas]ENO00267.1 diguanylate cyclase [Pseudoalteromonas agarivorans S816]TMS67993.1 phosphodiesterase [Pseudoalteromonas sp. S1691]TMS72645.1 phosphodiesterase [Pseudoalteromonas sp. S1731]TMS75118.1 phosphodiesterase [Pseudoalteromonas sp. S1941]TMS77377.1 phosphodiesterase [Pseudoalteromonas sp. S1690]
MNKFKLLGGIFFVFILFCFCLNIELTNQINRINLFNPDIDLRHFDIVDTTLEMAPWYNPMLNGHYLIHQPSADFLLVKTTDTEFIAANATKLILMTLTSPINFILVCMVLFVGFTIIRKERKKISYQHQIAQLNNNANQLLVAFNLQPQHDNPSGLGNLSQSINNLNTHVANYLKQTQTSICQDKLTLLIDRHAYIEHIDRQINFTDEEQLKCALLFIDLDGFKQVNDSFGHSFGDEILVQVATRLANVLRHHKLSNINEANQLEQNLSRLGGDEFSIFIESVDTDNKVVDIAKHVLSELEKDFVLGNKIIKISASIGIAAYPESASTPQALLQLADVAMYRAKSDGKGIFKVYSPEMGNKMRRYHYLLEELRLAVACKDFYLSFQPIVHVEDCMIDYFEALTRWDHPIEGMISPAEFIPIAEESNLILELGDWIMHESCRQMAAWHNAGMRKVKISVNVSGVQLKHRSVYDWIMKNLKNTGLPSHSLMLEITESTFIKASKSMIEELERLRAEGVTIAIDDFGTGFSSLSTLADLPIDVIKIDRSFISQADKSPKYNDILNTISELGQKLGLKIVAEGVEEIEQFELVKRMGVSSVQGYLVSRPQSSINVGNKVLRKNTANLSAAGTSAWEIES